MNGCCFILITRTLQRRSRTLMMFSTSRLFRYSKALTSIMLGSIAHRADYWIAWGRFSNALRAQAISSSLGALQFERSAAKRHSCSSGEPDFITRLISSELSIHHAKSFTFGSIAHRA